MVVASDPNRFMERILLLNFAMLAAIITYFTSMTFGLLLHIVFIFGYGTYTLYQAIVIGQTVGPDTYFWLLMTPLYTVAVWLLTLGMRQLQTENSSLKESNARLATMDRSTNLRNALLFQKDATVYMALSTRYGIPLTLLVMQVRYWNEVRRMISGEQMSEALFELSQMSEKSIRSNDTIYMLDNENATWGLLLFTDKEGATIVMDRLRSSARQLGGGERAGGYQVKLELRIGASQYGAESVKSPLDWIEKARKQLEYDV
ncbi:GGDEF domain-containing protein [Paenibacillus nanensis]|uniref:GGDEF domain-containing protein n=2 Tax=Paenibacillus nanensis TaxID=393251 RepID=A0A3A1URN4_9BACL|nr:GGDEF domain-containing protein [Paenibacillus nanensis]